MKKSLFLLPLLAVGLAVCGCDNGGGDTPSPSPSPSPSPTPSPTPGPEPTPTPVIGESIGKVDLMSASTKAKNVTDDSCTFTAGDCTISVSKGSCAQTVAQAVTASGTYEFRLYNKMSATLSCTQAFSAFKVVSTNYSDSKYVWDDPHLEGATFEFDGNITTTVYLDSAATSFSDIYAYKQIRIASIEFFK